MRLLADWTITHQGQPRTIELYQGDLAALPPEHAVDLLVVSAFPNNYAPKSGSLIGALYFKGVSVYDLAQDKQTDLRHDFSCWLSKPVPAPANFHRILCIESGWRGTPPQITDDIFRALAPAAMAEFAGGSVAMPLIGTGDQGYPPAEILTAILTAASFWLRRGLPIRTIKIVVKSDATATLAQTAFEKTRKELDPPKAQSRPTDRHIDLTPSKPPMAYAPPSPPLPSMDKMPTDPMPAPRPSPAPPHAAPARPPASKPSRPTSRHIDIDPLTRLKWFFARLALPFRQPSPPPASPASAAPPPPAPAPLPAAPPAAAPVQTHTFDIFLSYSHKDASAAKALRDQILRIIPNARIFFDQQSLHTGGSWLMEIAESLDSSRRVAALYTPNYWASKFCKDEFTAALLRQNDTGKQILFPIYFQETDIPYFFRGLQHVDCREADLTKLTEACNQLCQDL